jgi:hypothetical protein
MVLQFSWNYRGEKRMLIAWSRSVARVFGADHNYSKMHQHLVVNESWEWRTAGEPAAENVNGRR